MNMQFAHATRSSSELRVLNDNEIDDVNGGLLWFIAAAAYVIFVGVTAGYYGAKAIHDATCSCDK